MPGNHFASSSNTVTMGISISTTSDGVSLNPLSITYQLPHFSQLYKWVPSFKIVFIYNKDNSSNNADQVARQD